MTALDLLLHVGQRGVRFTCEADRVRVVDPERRITEDERSLLRALVPELRSLLKLRLPERRGDTACGAFEAAAGVALCERCAHSIADHFWRRCGDCIFFVGAADAARCRRCDAPRLEHFGITAG